MQMLYESERYLVVHLVVNEEKVAAAKIKRAAGFKTAIPPIRHAFEILNKEENKEVLLTGSWADLFKVQIEAWQHHTPAQQEVEAVLEGYTELGIPMSCH